MRGKITLVTGGLIAGVLVAVSATLIAGSVTLPNTFTSGTQAKASEVNANFNAVANQVNDNAARIITMESNVTGGNIVLAPSTAAEGNILKGADRFIHNFGTDNTFIGVGAGNSMMTGYENMASGVDALRFNTTGHDNTATGAFALEANTTGIHNTASGASALALNTTGSFNTANGAFALQRNTTGSDNTANGVNALQHNTIGANNTANGVSALNSNTSGAANTANGERALFSNTIGGNNTASGQGALTSNITGSNNTAIGAGALFNTTGHGNVAVGSAAGFNLTTGSNNIDIDNAGFAGESNTIRIGDSQTRAFIAGIAGVGVTGASVLVSSSGQLGVAQSSRRFKDAITDMGAASDVLMHLRPVTFYYKSDQNPKGRTLQYGLVAEEVARFAPELVAHSADGRIETVYYRFLAPMLLNEYQKQQRTIEAQGARIEALERDRKVQTDRIEALENQAARTAALLSRLRQAGAITAAAR